MRTLAKTQLKPAESLQDGTIIAPVVFG